MEGSENTLHRVSRVVWTVWGFLRGSVGRYLRPEVTNEEAHNDDTVREGSKEKEEEKEKTETKTSEREARKDLQCPGVSVRAAAVQWEKGTIAHDGHEVKDKSKHTCTSSEGTDEKSQTEKENDTGTHGNQLTEQDSPAYIDADVKHGDRTFSGSKEADLNVERIETKKLEEEGEEKIVRKEFDETEEEPIKSELIEQGLLAKEVDLNVERNENDQKQGREEEEEEEYVDGISRREYDETGEELIQSEFLEQAVLAREDDLNVERSENNQVQGRKQEEEEEEEYFDEIMMQENDETEEKTKKADLNVERSEYSEKQGRKSLEEEVVKEFMRRDTDETEEEPIKRDSVDQGLPTKEVDLNVERNENNQEQGRQEEEEEECVDEIMKTENDEIEEELIKSESIDQGLLTKEADLNVLRIEKSQEQRRKQEEEGEGIDEIMNREYDKTGEEPVKSKFLEQDLLAIEVDLNVERNENDEEQGRKQEEEEEYIDRISRREYDETGEELIQSEFLEQDLLAKEVDLNEEQGRKQEEEYVDGISRREHDETGEELIQSEFLEQDLLAREVDLIVERNENDEEQGREEEEEEEKEYVDGISRREYDEIGEELIQSEFLEQDLLAREVDIIVERNENNQEQGRKQEEEEEEEFIDEIITQENDETEEKPIKSEIIDLGVLTKEADINVERSEYSLEQRRKSKEEAFNEFTRTKTDETEEEPIKSESIDQGLLTLEADLNVERIEKSQEQRRKQEERGEGIDEIMNREYDKTGKEPVKSKFLEQDLLAIEVDLNVERNENDEEQGRKQEEEEEYVDGISRREYDETGEELIQSEFLEQDLLAKEVDLNVERNENDQKQGRKQEEEEEYVDGISRREYDETGEELIQSEFLEQELLAREDVLNVEGNENNQVQGRKPEEEFIDEIMMQENDETEEKTIKSEIIDLGVLTKEAGINVERSEYSQEQRRKSKEEDFNEFTRTKTDETEEEPIKSESIDQGLLTLEADLNVERIENTQEQSKKQEEEEEGAEIMKREKDETGEEPVKREFIEKALLAMEDDLNVEQNENDQEQGREEEEEEECVDEIMKTENDEIEEEPIKSESIDQGLLTKEADLNVLRIEKEQRRKQEEEGEGIDEIMNREYDKTGEEPVKSKFLEQDLLAIEVDLNVERNENDEEQGRKQEEEEEFIEEIMTQENDQTEEPIKSECIEQGLLTVEADLNVERIENTQEQSKKQEEEEEGAEIMKREKDETGEEPVKSEFIEKALLAMEEDVNVEQNENDQEQGRKEEEECVDEISRREYDETGEEPIKSKLTEQGLLSNEADFERNENNQEQGRKEEEEYVDEVRKRPNNETDEEPIKSELTDQGFLTMEGALNVERNENSQEQEEEGVDEIMRQDYDVTGEEPIKSEFIDHRGEQASVCDMGDTAVVQVISVEESIMECVYDHDKNELNVVEQSIHVTAKHEHEASKSQIVDEGLFIQLASTWEESLPLHDSLKLDVEMTANATLLQETEVTDVDNEEAKQETVGKEKDGYQEEFSAWEQFTGTGIAEEPKVKETLKQIPDKVIDRTVETECDLLETAEMENADKYKKVSEPSNMFKDEDNNLTDTMNLCQLEQSKEQEATSEVALNVDLRQLDDKVHDHNGSQQPAVMTKQGNEGVITRPEKGTGNQMETVETTSMFRAEVAAVDMKKSPERENSSYEQPIDAEEEVAVQEIMGQCDLEKESLLDESADTRIHDLSLLKAPFSEIKSVLLEQADETVVESVDEMPSSSLQELEEFSSEAQQQVGAKSNSPEQTAEVFETFSEVTEMNRDELKPEQAQPECEVSLEESTWDKSTLDETPLEDQTSQAECTVQDAEASSHRLQIVTEQETLEMQNDSQKGTEDQERTEEAESGFRVASCSSVVEEITSGLTTISEDSESELMREMEAPELKEHKNELESCEETSDSKMNVELPNETWECEKDSVAGMTDTESMVVVSAGGEMESVKKTEESMTEEEKDACQLVFPESESSKEISKEHAGKVEHEKSLVDSKEDVEERGRPGLKRGFEKMAGEDDTDKPPVLKGLLLPSQASSLDFTAQKSKIAVKNPLVRPPKDPRMLINMASVEPLTPPHPSKPSFLKKSHIEGASVPSKGVIGFKLPGLGAGFPALRKTEAGRKIRDGEDSESVTAQAQKSDSGSQSADDHVKQETPPPKPKWKPPRQPGMGSPLMMAELKSKLKKPAKE